MLNRDLIAASWRDWYGFSLDPCGPAWLQWAWTGLFCLAVAAAITTLDVLIGGVPTPGRLARIATVNTVISLTIGLLIQAGAVLIAAMLGTARLRRLSARATALTWGALALAGVLAGWPLGLTLAGGDFLAFATSQPRSLRGALVFSLLLTAVIYVWFVGKAGRAEAERRATEAQLKLLQAQIEPHFLFNTLANVLSLMEHDTARARRMLEAFVEVLRASLGRLRDDEATLGDELHLVEAYLALQATRMDDRLRFAIDADADARAAALPPLLLQPLVENAVRHGLEPKIEGGTVSVRAAVQGGRLVIAVEDDGLGLDAASPAPPRGGNGVALDNVRRRLASRHGAAASLTLERRTPAGVRVTLVLPCQPAAPCPPP